MELSAHELTKEYPNRGDAAPVLRGVSLHLQGGENVAILGPSGCGKSTLLHLLGGLDTPSSGHVILNGQDPAGLDEAALARFRNQQIGFIFQDHHLLPQCSVLENVLLPTLAKGALTRERIERAQQLLGRVGLADRGDSLPGELSGGERQRVAIARALIGSPSLLLADEPTGNLDRRTAAQVSDQLLKVQRETGAMLVLVTHSEALAEQLQRRYWLSEGRLVDSLAS